MRRLWQGFWIALACSPRLKVLMQGRHGLSGLASRFVAGPDRTAAIARAQMLARDNRLRGSLFYLGEYLSDPAMIAATVVEKQALIAALGASGLDLHVSIDPTQIGLSLAPDMARDNALLLGRALAAAAASSPAGPPGERVSALMLDMEDAATVPFTLDLYRALRAEGIPAAITLQCYLRRTPQDLAAIIADGGGRVRLVRGAFIGEAGTAYTVTSEIKAAARRLIDQMFAPSAREAGFYPIIATHDTRLHAHAQEAARRHGWPPGSYEFEMLLGVRPEVAEALAAQGERVRLYLPYGADWWPYAARRIGENPRNALLLGRAVVGR